MAAGVVLYLYLCLRVCKILQTCFCRYKFRTHNRQFMITYKTQGSFVRTAKVCSGFYFIFLQRRFKFKLTWPIGPFILVFLVLPLVFLNSKTKFEFKLVILSYQTSRNGNQEQNLRSRAQSFRDEAAAASASASEGIGSQRLLAGFPMAAVPISVVSTSFSRTERRRERERERETRVRTPAAAHRPTIPSADAAPGTLDPFFRDVAAASTPPPLTTASLPVCAPAAAAAPVARQGAPTVREFPARGTCSVAHPSSVW
jgi:hypothetical protein